MSYYPQNKLTQYLLYTIEENIKERIIIRNIKNRSIQEICLDVTDLIKNRPEVTIIDKHKICILFNRLNKLEDSNFKQNVLSKPYNNAMNIISREIVGILDNYVNIPGSLYELSICCIEGDEILIRYSFDDLDNGESFERKMIIDLFNDIINKSTNNNTGFITQKHIHFKKFPNLTCMMLTKQNYSELLNIVYRAIVDDDYGIIDLRPNIQTRKDYVRIDLGSKRYIINETDIVVKTDCDLIIMTNTMFDTLFNIEAYADYIVDSDSYTLTKEDNNEPISCKDIVYKYKVSGTLPYIENINDTGVSGNCVILQCSIPKELDDFDKYPEIYIDDSPEPTTVGVHVLFEKYSLPNRIAIPLLFTKEITAIDLKIKWDDNIVDNLHIYLDDEITFENVVQ